MVFSKIIATEAERVQAEGFLCQDLLIRDVSQLAAGILDEQAALLSDRVPVNEKAERKEELGAVRSILDLYKSGL